MLRAMPTISAAGSMLCMPSRYTSTGPLDAESADESGGEAANQKRGRQFVESPAEASAPYTYAAIGASTSARMITWRRPVPSSVSVRLQADRAVARLTAASA